jgi:hypothetical protein
MTISLYVYNRFIILSYYFAINTLDILLQNVINYLILDMYIFIEYFIWKFI